MDEIATYKQPQVRDYGDLLELTAAIDFSGMEDGNNKNLPHHNISDGILPQQNIWMLT